MPSFIGVFDNIDEGGASVFFAVVCGLALLIGFGVNFLIVYPKMKMIKKIDAEIINLKNDLEATLKKIRELETESEKLSDDIRKAIQDLIRIDRRIVTDPVKEQVPEFGKIKQHQCPSCGGSWAVSWNAS